MRRLTRTIAAPHEIDDRNWFYDEHGGLNLVHQVYRDQKDYLRIDQILIPRKALLDWHQRHTARGRKRNRA